MTPKLKDMTPTLQLKYAAFAAKMSEARNPFVLNCVARTVDEQEAFYAQGRETLAKVNELRLKAGMYLLKSEKENYRVTTTKNSRHFPDPKAGNRSHAFDIAIVRDGNIPTWDTKWDGNKDGISDYLEAAYIGKLVGLNPGGLWKKFKDWPHYEEVIV
jgi:hypothetical protein